MPELALVRRVCHAVQTARAVPAGAGYAPEVVTRRTTMLDAGW